MIADRGRAQAHDDFDALAELFLGEGGRTGASEAGAGTGLSGTLGGGAPPAGEIAPAVEALVLGHVPTMAASWASQYARWRAEASGKPVAVVRLGDGRARVEIFNSALGPAGPTPAIDLSASIQLARRLVHHVIVLPAPGSAADCDALVARAGGVTLLTTPDEAGLVAAYGSLKRLAPVCEPGAPGGGKPLRIVAVGATAAKAQPACRRLQDAAASFLRVDTEASVCIERLGGGHAPVTLFDGPWITTVDELMDEVTGAIVLVRPANAAAAARAGDGGLSPLASALPAFSTASALHPFSAPTGHGAIGASPECSSVRMKTDSNLENLHTGWINGGPASPLPAVSPAITTPPSDSPTASVTPSTSAAPAGPAGTVEQAPATSGPRGWSQSEALTPPFTPRVPQHLDAVESVRPRIIETRTTSGSVSFASIPLPLESAADGTGRSTFGATVLGASEYYAPLAPASPASDLPVVHVPVASGSAALAGTAAGVAGPSITQQPPTPPAPAGQGPTLMQPAYSGSSAVPTSSPAHGGGHTPGIAGSIGAPASSARASASTRLLDLLPGTSPLSVRCPHAEGVELGLDRHGQMHAAVLAEPGQEAAAVQSLIAAGSWAHMNRHLLALVMPGLATSNQSPLMHIFTQHPAGCRNLLDSPIKIHGLAVVTNQTSGFVSLDLN